ncbi:hypothetical protein J1N35_008414 [Gossypium stocksii]|uniref:Uncharacterized protein n=1 Tax=Gossypium stocksii TaxID=47602 RepID=A0A9D4AGN7_9ROSI|nr:hypothetical protein J1N35_008414 [Gossypium stocksii]
MVIPVDPVTASANPSMHNSTSNDQLQSSSETQKWRFYHTSNLPLLPARVGDEAKSVFPRRSIMADMDKSKMSSCLRLTMMLVGKTIRRGSFWMTACQSVLNFQLKSVMVGGMGDGVVDPTAFIIEGKRKDRQGRYQDIKDNNVSRFCFSHLCQSESMDQSVRKHSIWLYTARLGKLQKLKDISNSI